MTYGASGISPGAVSLSQTLTLACVSVIRDAPSRWGELGTVPAPWDPWASGLLGAMTEVQQRSPARDTHLLFSSQKQPPHFKIFGNTHSGSGSTF